jgi:excisionase family DNA binding protein
MPQTSSPPSRRRFLTVSQAADVLQVSPVTLYRSIGTGELPAIKLRGRYIIPSSALDALEAAALEASAFASPHNDSSLEALI